MNEFFNNHLTKVMIFAITVLELVMTGNMGYSIFLWVGYGIYQYDNS